MRQRNQGAAPGLAQGDRRVAIAGLGSIGRRHLENLRSLGVEHILVHTRHAEAARLHTGGRVVSELDEALAMRPDVIFVCTPTACHVPVALAAARAGVHLFIEKPLSDSTSGIGDLSRIVTEKGLIAMVGFDLRFDPGLRRVKSLLDEGRIGRVLSVQAQAGQYLPDWRPDRDYRTCYSARASLGGGVVMDLTHEFDYLAWLLGPISEVSCVSAHVSELEIDTEDVAVMALRFASGAVGTVHLDYLQRVATRTCRLIGERGTIEWDYHAHSVSTLLPGGGADRFSYTQFTRNDRFVAEVRHLLACLDGDAVPPCDLYSAERTLRLALAAKASTASRRACPVH